MSGNNSELERNMNFHKENSNNRTEEVPPELSKETSIMEIKRMERRRLIRGFVLLCLIENLSFSSFIGLLNSTTSLLPTNHLGQTGITVGNAMEIIVSIFLMSFATQYWGIKKILLISSILSSLYPLSFFYPVPYIFYPASAVKGAVFAFIVTGVYVYGSKLVYRYHSAVGGNLDVMMILMTGINYGSIGCGYLWGNVLVYQILNNPETYNSSETISKLCGSAYCNEDLSELSTTQPPPDDKYYTLIGTYSGLMILASIVCAFLETLPNPSIKENVLKYYVDTLKSTFMLILDTRGYLLIIITLFAGAKEAFMVTVFTYAFVNCMLGVAYVGNIMLVYGFALIVISTCNWLFVKVCGRITVIACCILVIIACYLTMLFYPFSTSEHLLPIYFIIVSTYAAAASVAVTTVLSVYAVLFPEDVEGAYGVSSIWWTIGAFICNFTSNFLCVSTKLYSLIALAALGFLLYVYLEFLIRKGKFNKPNIPKE